MHVAEDDAPLTGEKKPAEHVAQAAALVAPDSVEYVPAWQALQRLLLLIPGVDDQVPGMQFWQAVTPPLADHWPGGQFRQTLESEAPAMVEYVPA